VSARAKLNDTKAFQTVISQDAENISGFAIQYDPDSDRWEMITPEEDDDESKFIQAGSGPGPAADRWTYLTGVHDAAAGEIRLYVDGHLEDTARIGGDGGSAGGLADRGYGSSSTSTTTTTTTSGGGSAFNGGRFDGGTFGGGPGGFDGASGAGGGGGYFGGASGASGNELADEVFQDVTGRLTEIVDAEGDFAVGRGLAGEEYVRGFDGSIDDVRAFKRALTADEVAALAGR
jgi:concanavalin A-like lectin/glucanase superfamily protein